MADASRFERGYLLAEQGNLEGAIDEFQRAYALSPHYSVLYNLAQAHAAAGHPVEAVAAFRRYLTEGGDAISGARRAQVQAAMAYHGRRIGRLRLRVNPASATISVDGRALGSARGLGELELSSGQHLVLVEAPHHLSRPIEIEIEGGLARSLNVELYRDTPGTLQLSCPLPDVRVRVDGAEPRAFESSEIVALAAGRHEVIWERSGYLPNRRSYDVTAGARLQAPCALRLDPDFVPLVSLRVNAPRGTKVLIDGLARAGASLPPGRHRVQVSGPGVLPLERLVVLRAGAPLRLDLAPELGPEALRAAERRRNGQLRGAAFVVGASGIVSLSAALGLYLYNSGKRDAWERSSADLVREGGTNSNVSNLNELDDLIDEANAIRDRDSVALVAGAVGAMALATSATLLLWTSSSSKARTVMQQRRLSLELRF